MNPTGILFGLFTILAIGIGFVWVIKLEYCVGAHVAKAVMALGMMLILVSLLTPDFVLSAIIGILGGTVIWGSTELPPQAERVARGLFPANPRKRVQGDQQ